MRSGVWGRRAAMPSRGVAGGCPLVAPGPAAARRFSTRSSARS